MRVHRLRPAPAVVLAAALALLLAALAAVALPASGTTLRAMDVAVGRPSCSGPLNVTPAAPDAGRATAASAASSKASAAASTTAGAGRSL